MEYDLDCDGLPVPNPFGEMMDDDGNRLPDPFANWVEYDRYCQQKHSRTLGEWENIHRKYYKWNGWTLGQYLFWMQVIHSFLELRQHNN